MLAKAPISLSRVGIAGVSLRRPSTHLRASPRSYRMSARAEAASFKTDAEWKSSLTEMEYHVLRNKGTERPMTGEYNKFYPPAGHFTCRGCGNPLYSAASKFQTGCGWPAFDKCYTGAVKTEVDDTLGMRRVEILCAACDGHLGHVFEGENATITNERHCVNSISIKFVSGDPPEPLPEAKVCPKRWN